MMRIGKARGTGESPTGWSMLSPIDGDQLDYPAQIAPIGIMTYAQSVAVGVSKAAAYDKAGPWIGVGYSLGCCVLVEAARQRQIPNCRGLVLVANPLRCGEPTYGIAIAAQMTGRPQQSSVGWLTAGAVVASLWRYAVAGRHTAYGHDRMADGRTYVEVARDTANRMAGREG